MLQGITSRAARAIPRGSMSGSSIAQTRKALGDKKFPRWADRMLRDRKLKAKPGDMYKKLQSKKKKKGVRCKKCKGMKCKCK